MLSPGLQEIAEHIGLEGALKLAQNYGGTRLWVPCDGFSLLHPIAAKLDIDELGQLNYYYRNSLVYIPRGCSFFKRQRDQQVVEAKAKMTVAEVAIQYGIVERRVYQIINSLQVA
jgi:hypothetical protein